MPAGERAVDGEHLALPLGEHVGRGVALSPAGVAVGVAKRAALVARHLAQGVAVRAGRRAAEGVEAERAEPLLLLGGQPQGVGAGSALELAALGALRVAGLELGREQRGHPGAGGVAELAALGLERGGVERAAAEALHERAPLGSGLVAEAAHPLARLLGEAVGAPAAGAAGPIAAAPPHLAAAAPAALAPLAPERGDLLVGEHVGEVRGEGPRRARLGVGVARREGVELGALVAGDVEPLREPLHPLGGGRRRALGGGGEGKQERRGAHEESGHRIGVGRWSGRTLRREIGPWCAPLAMPSGPHRPVTGPPHPARIATGAAPELHTRAGVGRGRARWLGGPRSFGAHLPDARMALQMVDLGAEVADLRPALDAALADVLDTRAFVRGPVVRAFEAELGAWMAARADGLAADEAHVISCGNGTDAIQIALMALGVGPGDEVVCPSFTFVATAEAAALLGATPVFCDIDPATFNLDAAKLPALLTARTRAVVPVHLFGQAADLDAVRAACAPRGIPVVEDAAQAVGATWRGRAAGFVGALGTLSFYPSKNLGAYGDGGAVLATDPELAERARHVANHGAAQKYHHTRIGVNSRLDAMQAAVLRVKLRELTGWTDARRAAAALYDAHLAGAADVVRPARDPHAGHVFHQYTVRVPADARDALRAELRAQGIPTMVYYPEPIHLMPAFPGGAPGDLPETERACREVLSLPMHPYLSPADVAGVAEAVGAFFGAAVAA